jgi:hypothetical protein
MSRGRLIFRRAAERLDRYFPREGTKGAASVFVASFLLRAFV